MLENMRRQGASIFVYLIFCLLIAIFVINFRPGQTRSDESGCSGPSNLVVSVDGNDTSHTAFLIALKTPYNRGTEKQKTWIAIEQLIRREILASEADKRGLRANNALIQKEIQKGHFYLGGQELMIPGIFDENGYWRLQAYKNWVASLYVSRPSYEDEQERGLLASMMADLIKSEVVVSRDEALAQYLYDNTLVKYDVVAFNPDDYRAAMKLTDADIDRYLAEHADEVSKRYKADERLYKGVKKQLKLREIFIAKAEPKKDDHAGSGSGSGSGSAAPTAPAEDGKAKLDAARAEVASGKKKFADVAKELWTDSVMKASGGDVGWRSADAAMFGETAVNEAVKALEPGEMTPVVTTDKGSYLIMAEDKREGDLTFDQVKHEIAVDLAKDTWAKEAAKRAALDALAKAKAGEPLDKMFQRGTAEPYMPPAEIKKQIKQLAQALRSGAVPDELRQQLQEQLYQLEQYLQIQRAQILSMREVAVGDQPASWDADEDGDGGGGGATKGSGSATGSGAATATGTGSGTGSATAAGTGSGSGSGSGAGPVAAPPEMTASKDVLPQFGEVAPPKVETQGPAPRMLTMPGVGKSAQIETALFDELGQGELAKTIYEADGKFVLIQLLDKTQPKITDFDKEADEDTAELQQQRASEALDGWLKDRCETLAKAGKIKIAADLLRETDDKGNVVPTQYKPCMSFR